MWASCHAIFSTSNQKMGAKVVGVKKKKKEKKRLNLSGFFSLGWTLHPCCHDHTITSILVSAGAFRGAQAWPERSHHVGPVLINLRWLFLQRHQARPRRIIWADARHLNTPAVTFPSDVQISQCMRIKLDKTKGFFGWLLLLLFLFFPLIVIPTKTFSSNSTFMTF